MDSVQCSGCGETVTPHKLNLAQAKPGKNGEPGGGYFMAATCPRCNVALGREAPPAPLPQESRAEPPVAADLGNVIGLGGIIGHDRAVRVMAQDAPAPAAAPSLAPIVLAPCAPPSTDSIIEMATARLEFVGVEIAKLRGFEDESALLERMIAAAAPQSAEREVS